MHMHMHTGYQPSPGFQPQAFRTSVTASARRCTVGKEVKEITDRMAKKDDRLMQLKSACASQTAYLLKGESNKEACCCTKLDRRFGIIGRPQITSEYDCTVHISFGNSFASSPPAATITKLGRQSQELDKLIQEREAIEKDIELAKKNEVEEAKQLVDNYETQVNQLNQEILNMKNEMQKAREEVVKIEARQAEEEKCKKCGAPVDEDGNFKGCACKHDHGKADKAKDDETADDSDDAPMKKRDSLAEVSLHGRRCADGGCEAGADE